MVALTSVFYSSFKYRVMKISVDDSDEKRVGEEDDVIVVFVIYNVIGTVGKSIRLNNFRARSVQEF